jgi:hypothetical protein
MTVQATVGSTVLAAAVGIGTAGGGTSAPVLAAQTTQTLAFTGASHISLMVTLALLMIVGGVLMSGLSRRHSLSFPAAMAGSGPPITP